MQELLTADDVAKLLSVSARYVVDLARRGTLKAVNLASHTARALWRFRRDDVERFISVRAFIVAEPGMVAPGNQNAVVKTARVAATYSASRKRRRA